MSRAASRTSNSVSLFPFLAVLVCAMGALIFLLLVTTRRIRDDARQRITAEQPEPVEVSVAVVPKGPPLIPPVPVVTVPVEPEPIPVIEPEPEPLPEPDPVYVTLPAKPDPNVELRRAIARLEAELKTRRDRAARARSTLDTTETNVAALEAAFARTEEELERNRRSLAALLAKAGSLQTERATVEREYEDLGERLRRAKERPEVEQSKFAFVPHDGNTGTNRRPIYIECNEDGLRFQPEDVLLTEQDLVGFTLGYNPLLAGTRTLVSHFDGIDRRENPAASKPYVLLIVRPGGEASYYAARRLLEQLGEPFGYELVPEEFELAAGATDPVAKRLLVDETNRLLAERANVVATVAGLPGMGGGGDGDGPFRSTGLRGTPGGRDNGPAGPGTSPGANRGVPGTPGTGDADAEPDSIAPFVGMVRRPRVGIGDAHARGGHVVREYPRQGSGDGVRTADVGESDGRPRIITGGGGAEPEEPGRPGGAPPREGLRDLKGETTDDVFPSMDDYDSPFDANEAKPDDVFERATNGHPTAADGVAGGHPAVSRSGIGFERAVPVTVFRDRLVVNDRFVLPFERGQSADDLAAAVVTGVERATSSWGRPPRGFHWVPSVRFRVQPGGAVHYERIKSRLERSRLKTSVDYELEGDDGPTR